MAGIVPRRRALGWIAALASVGLLLMVSAAGAADDTTPPSVGIATLSPAPDGNANWRRQPATLNLAATDDVAVAKFQYSLDNGATYVDVPVTPAPSVTATVELMQEGNTTVRYRAVDTSGNLSPGVTANTTLSAAAAAGATGIRLASTTGRSAGDALVIDTGANAETATIASVVTPNPPSPNPNVILAAPLAKAHAAGAPVAATPPYRTIALLIDTFAPIAGWPQIVDGKIMQSQTLTPTRSDPRRRDASDTANGSGGAAIRRMEVDGEHRIPQPLALNRLTVGEHTQAVALQDAAGNALEYTQTFVVATSFDDLDTVVGQYADNALRTTLNGATAAGATGLRLATPYGFRAGQTLVVDSGANAETVTIESAPSPPPTLAAALTQPAAAGATGIRLATTNVTTIAGSYLVLDTGANQELLRVAGIVSPAPADPTAPNVLLEEPLAKDHAAGAATTLANVTLSSPLTLPHASGTVVVNPRPLISESTAAALRSLLAEAKAAAEAGNPAGAISALNQFSSVVFAQVKPSAERKAERAALSSAARALIDELKGRPLDTSGTGVTTAPWTPVLRVFTDPTPFTPTPGATYKVLVNGQTRGFRHEHIVDTEALVQKMGAANGFDVEIWDPNLGLSPGRQSPAGVSLTANPLLDLDKLMEYETLVFASTVGRGAQGLTAAELANLQAYVRAGGGFVAIHGATDAMQDSPWYMDLVGAGFTNHGSNAGGIMPDCGACGEVELVTVDPSHATTKHLAPRFTIHEELYNTNRNPVELGLVHPLMLENEDTLVGQIGYSTGSLMNSDRHGMTWCRNFDGGRSFTTVIGHSWALTHDAWYQEMLLRAIQSTAGAIYANCVTFKEVGDLLAAAAADGNVNGVGEAVLGAELAGAKAEFDRGNYKRSLGYLEQFVRQTRKPANCVSDTGACPDGGAALAELALKGQELIDWAKGLQ